MSDTTVEVRWEDGQRFSARGADPGAAPASLELDGRRERAPSPTEALLMAVASCMGIDVVEILEKGRVPVESLTVRAEGDRRAEPPRYFTAVRLEYRVTGVPAEARPKLERAVELSRDKYCSVLHSLRSDVQLSIRIETD